MLKLQQCLPSPRGSKPKSPGRLHNCKGKAYKQKEISFQKGKTKINLTDMDFPMINLTYF